MVSTRPATNPKVDYPRSLACDKRSTSSITRAPPKDIKKQGTAVPTFAHLGPATKPVYVYVTLAALFGISGFSNPFKGLRRPLRV